MSFPHPQDHNRGRRERGEQTYRAARQAMTETDASMQAEAEAFGEARRTMTEEERIDNLKADAIESMRHVGDDLERSRKRR